MYPFKFAVVNRNGVPLAVFRDDQDAFLYVEAFYEAFNVQHFVVPFSLEHGAICWGE